MMKFNIGHSLNQNKEEWDLFNDFLETLSSEYADEFKKEMYSNERFIAIGISGNPADIIYAFNPSVPDEIQRKIVSKLQEIFP
jgi:hypothetical protein